MIKTLFAFLVLTTSIFAQGRPAPEREFRGVWIATVDNIDFPTKKTLSVDEQKAELLKDLDLARKLNLNAVIFQVRPMCDAIYESKLEPWSEFLTGEMGRGQKFDPLAFVVAEAHKRGILVHAWFNPYRAYHPAAKTVSPDHITKRRPDLVRDYGKFKWLDPSEPEVQKYSLDVVLDVVRRYDIDGVHFDDYFYPYAERDEKGNRIEFPDEKNYRKYVEAAMAAASKMPGKKPAPLGRETWRRMQVDRFIEQVARGIKRIKPRVLFGISPFGVPEGNFNELYADAEGWLRSGLVDYFVPQLYWRIDRKTREFALLLKRWENANAMKRHVWTGIGTYKLYEPRENYSTREILDQIGLTRKLQTTRGQIHFSFKSLLNDADGLQNGLLEGPYKHAVLPPATPWIRSQKLPRPKVVTKEGGATFAATWNRVNGAFWYVVYVKDRNGWNYSVQPAAENSIVLSLDRGIEKIQVEAVDRLGN